ncbi:MAG: type II toxin-antitoxin system mRNA interferase toxin, RelE/StbE family [bacterium]|nr:type II toxin-antitoxin system mRNA interferase toxin, RelE/StbE family [bacterium]
MPEIKKTRIEFSKRFEKQLLKAPLSVRVAVRRRIERFLHNPREPRLRDHALTGNYRGFRSINITGDWRAIFSEESLKGIKVVRFYVLGTHSQLYR